MGCCCVMMSGYQVPPLRPEGAPRGKGEVAGSWLESYLEGKDEILLYMTAALGVLMPGMVYLLYHKCHAYYEKYARRKEEERMAEELAQSEAAVIVLGNADGHAGAWGKILHSKLCEEMVRQPMIWYAETLQIKEFSQFKGFCIFITETCIGGGCSPATEWLLEWLEDLAADSKTKKKANFDKIRFSVVGFGSSADGYNAYNKTAKTVMKRMKILGSKQMLGTALFDTLTQDEKLAEKFESFSYDLLVAMDRHLPGETALSDTESVASNSDESTDESELEESQFKKEK